MAIKRDTIFFLVSRVFCGWNFCAHTGYIHTGSSSSPRTHTHTHTHALFCCFVHEWCCYTTILVLLFFLLLLITQTKTYTRTNARAYTPPRIRRKSRITGHTRGCARSSSSTYTHTHTTAPRRLLSFHFFFIPHLKKKHTNPYIPCTLDFCHREKG